MVYLPPLGTRPHSLPPANATRDRVVGERTRHHLRCIGRPELLLVLALRLYQQLLVGMASVVCLRLAL